MGFKPSIENIEAMTTRRNIKGLIKVLLNAEEPNARYLAAIGLGDIGDRRAVEPLIEAMSDEDDGVRLAARKMLRNIGKPAVEPLIRCLESENYIVRWYAAVSLGEIGDKRAKAPLIKALMDDKKEVRGGAAGALKYIGGPEAVEPLIKCLDNDENWINRRLAAISLGTIKNKRAVEPLNRALKDKIDDVQKAAREALKNINEWSRT